MRIKSFYASSVEGAVAIARREFGEDAILVESRKAPLEARHLGEYEVVCALITPAEASEPAGAEPSRQDARLAAELAEMRRQLDLMEKTISRTAWSGAPGSSGHPELSEWHSRLLAADMDGDVVLRILDAVRRRGVPDDALDDAVCAELEEITQVNAALAPGGADGPRIAALVGPPGAGKTTMIAKLAITCGLAARQPVLLFSMDDYRVAGADQLRAYAAILGVGFQALENVSALGLALDQQRGKHLILIDTPGYGARDMDRAAELARFLSARPNVATHLVLTACTKSADLTRVAERFEIFQPSSLLFTRLDETSSIGTALSLSVRRGKPISFLGTGQDIPEDVVPAAKAGILNLLGSPLSTRARRAA